MRSSAAELAAASLVAAEMEDAADMAEGVEVQLAVVTTVAEGGGVGGFGGEASKGSARVNRFELHGSEHRDLASVGH